MHYAQIFQSHSLHFFHLASPDLLFGIDADPSIRNVIHLAKTNKDLAVKGVMMRKFGQELILTTAGKKIHGTGAIPGGVNKNVSAEERDKFVNGADPLNPQTMIEWAQFALEFFKEYYRNHKEFIDTFSIFPSNHLSLVRKDGALDLYHGVLRAVDSEGKKILHDVEYQEYFNYIHEEVRSWSYMKFPYLAALGEQRGWYRVGPLARLNTCDFIPTPLAQAEFEQFKALTHGKPNNMCMHTHYARLIELLHAGEVINLLLNDADLQGEELVRKGEKKLKVSELLKLPEEHYSIIIVLMKMTRLRWQI